MNALFTGTKKTGKVHYLVFDVDTQNVEIPVPEHIVKHIMAYLQKYSKPNAKPVEFQNDEESL